MPGGAEHLANIYGTEEDKVHCPFYLKVGACRHGDRCSRQHIQPLHSPTICLPHMWENPLAAMAAQQGYGSDLRGVDMRKVEADFEEFYIDVYEELSQYGEIDELVVVDNLCDHLVGNVMCRYFDEEDADLARRSLHGRWYGGKQLVCEFSPVSDFRDARCRQFDEQKCRFRGQCNFLHLKPVHRALLHDLTKMQPHKGERSRDIDRRDRGRDRRYDDRRHDDRRYNDRWYDDRRGRDYDDRDRHHRSRDYERRGDGGRDRGDDGRRYRERSRSPPRRRRYEEAPAHASGAGGAGAPGALPATGSA